MHRRRQRLARLLLALLIFLLSVLQVQANAVSHSGSAADGSNSAVGNKNNDKDNAAFNMAAGPNISAMGAESALLDKETGRVIWQSGASTSSLSSSVVNPYLQGFGLRHVKATILSSLLLMIVLGAIANWMREQLLVEGGKSSSSSWPASILLFVANWTLLKIPTFEKWFLVTILVLYLLESYTCSTRRYLDNAISSPTEVESYIESLRKQDPVVTWKVRSFHYQARLWLAPLLSIIQRLQGMGPDERAHIQNTPSLFKKKVITNRVHGNYNFTSCKDNTIAGVWKKSLATDVLSAPFAKISLSKLLILQSQKARQDYFAQQSNFVTQHGQGDEYAEFSTNIHVEGFKPRMLAVRDVQGVPSAKLFRVQLYWFFTLLGLTLPYRIWFARHCDELRVTVIKEVSSDKKKSSSSWGGWFGSSSKSVNDSVSEAFRKRMQQFALYQNEQRMQETATTNEQKQAIADAELLVEDMAAAASMANDLDNQSENHNETLTEESSIAGSNENSPATEEKDVTSSDKGGSPSPES